MSQSILPPLRLAAWEGDRRGSRATHESGDRPVDKPTFERAGVARGENTLNKALFISLLLSQSHVAVAAGAELPEPVDQIIVTGARAPLALKDVGSAVTVLSRDEIERRQARYVTDLLRAVPGFSVSRAGVAGSQTQVRVRGAEANHVLVMVDGVRANDPAAGDEFRWEFLTTGDIERIEIVRGPQSSLWGSDAVAAVVHVITRSGQQTPELSAFLETGSNETFNAAVNGGLGGERWSLSAAVERLSTDGENIARTGDENDESAITTASLSADLQLSEALSADLRMRRIDAYSQFDGVDYAVTGLPADSDVATDVTQTLLQAGIVLSPSDSLFTHRLHVRYFGSDNRNLASGVQDMSTASDRTTFVYQSDIAIGENLLALAAEHEKTSFQQRGDVGLGDPNQDQQMEVTSFIADFQDTSRDDVTWLLSARYDDNSDFGDALTGRIALAWELSDGLTLRASAGAGRKNPTFIERFGFFPGQFVGNPELEPERSTSYEIGLEHRLLDNRLDVRVAAFQQDLEDEIDGFVFDPETFLATAENISGSSKRRGAEIDARWALTPDVELVATYTYTDSRDQERSELRRPRHAGSVHFRFDFLNDRAGISLAADYGGTRHDLFFPPWPASPEYVTLRNYWLAELSGQYDLSPSIKLFARIANLTDSDYEQVYGYRTPGRLAFAGIRLNF